MPSLTTLRSAVKVLLTAFFCAYLCKVNFGVLSERFGLSERFTQKGVAAHDRVSRPSKLPLHSNAKDVTVTLDEDADILNVPDHLAKHSTRVQHSETEIEADAKLESMSASLVEHLPHATPSKTSTPHEHDHEHSDEQEHEHERGESSKPSEHTHEGGHHAKHDLMEHFGEEQHGSGGHHNSGEALLFLFLMLFLGGATEALIYQLHLPLPYTCVLLMEGIGIGIWYAQWGVFLNMALSRSIQMWTKMDPHLILFIFLPALVFADCMHVEFQIFKRCFWQCVLLAGPGVVFGTVGVAAYAKYVFPYDWSWSMSMTFGTMLAATDPVAVVSILNSLGASPKLTVVIAGESLLNDGTAVVIFNICNAMLRGTPEAREEIGVSGDTIKPFNMFVYFLRMAFGGPLLGFVFGLAAVFFIGKVSSKTNHADAMSQFAITICTAYFSFIVAECCVGVSGVLAVVVAGIMVGVFGKPRFVDAEGMNHAWHLLEWLFNTVIFVLSGFIMGATLWRRTTNVKGHSFAWADVLDLLKLYGIAVVGGRFLMFALFYPFLTRMGYGFSLKKAAVASWGGLRGAVGMALAIVVCDQLDDSLNGLRITFHVSGIAILTLLVNGMTSGKLLSVLGMASTPETKDRIFEEVCQKINARSNEAFEEVITDVCKIQGTSKEGVMGHCVTDDGQSELRQHVKSMCSRLESLHMQPKTQTKKPTNVEDAPADQDDAIRELFLAVLRSYYMEIIDDGKLPKDGREALILIESVDVARDDISKLTDIETVFEYIRPQHKGCWIRFLDTLAKVFGHQEIDERGACYLLTCLIEAHDVTQERVMSYTSSSKPSEALTMVINESKETVKMAQQELEKMSKEMLMRVVAQQVSKTVLEKEREFIMTLLSRGLLDQKQAHELLHTVEHDQKSTDRVPEFQ